MFVECGECFAWAPWPHEEREEEFVLSCPRCGKRMVLCRGLDPVKDLAYSEKDRVEVRHNA